MDATTSMNTVVNGLATSLSVENLWGVVAGISGLLVIGVLFGLGYRLLRRVTKGISQGKAKS